MKHFFNPLATIAQLLRQHTEAHGRIPRAILVSRELYRRILEQLARHAELGNLVIGIRPVRTIQTPCGEIPLVVDELLSESEIHIMHGGNREEDTSFTENSRP